MNDTTIEPDSPAERTEPDELPTPWVHRRAPEHSNKITVAWSMGHSLDLPDSVVTARPLDHIG